MAHRIVNGIVTRYVNYKDNDRILTIFSQECGRIDAKARGCRRGKSPLLACAQPFVYGEYQLYTGKAHATVDQCDIKETFYPIREDYTKLTAGSAMLALTQQVIQEEEQSATLFSLLYHCLSFLSYGGADALDLMVCFLARFLDAQGICPTITRCARCAKDLRGEAALYFSPRMGGALCDTCETGDMRVQPLSLEALRRILKLADTELDSVRLPQPVRRELFTMLGRYLEYHLERANKPLLALEPLFYRENL